MADQRGKLNPAPGIPGRIRSKREPGQRRVIQGAESSEILCAGIQSQQGVIPRESVSVPAGIPSLSERKESVTTSTLVSGGAVTLLCVLIPNPARPGDSPGRRI